MPRTLFLTYADAAFRAGARMVANSARKAGFDEVIEASPADWEGTEFARANRAILEQPRGGGYWLWKPYLIRRFLERLDPADVLFYCDASMDGYYRFGRFPEHLVAHARRAEQGFVIGPLIPQHGPLSRWTKRDALLLLDADHPAILSRPLVQATWSLWRRTDRAVRFLEDWLRACSDPRILTDQPNTLGVPNHPGFVDHRHDQSVLSILAFQRQAEVLDLSGSGVFRLMALRPQSELTHRLLKAPRNAERLLRGVPPAAVLAREQLSRSLARGRARFGGRPPQ